MHILIRLPNWLGDLVMATAFVRAVEEAMPGAQIDVIVKKGIDGIAGLIPGVNRCHVFSKQEYSGLTGAWRFGKMVGKSTAYDIMFCLPDSFSGAVMAKATGAVKRVGYRNELRSWLLTHTAPKNENLHRVEQYLGLLPLAGIALPARPAVYLQGRGEKGEPYIVVNLNSEATARRMPVEKGIALLNGLRAATGARLVLIGSEKELPHVTGVYNGMADKQGVELAAGKTSLLQLAELLAGASAMLTTDSGPMHLANALGVPTISLFGAGNENNTGPYNRQQSTVIRNGQLDCEPCVKNICKFGVPRCLLQLNEELIIQAVLAAIQKD